ncbi:MAG: hypothetical protein ACTSWP_10730 [Candidatus Freyarchaeota archaeon]
MRKRGKKRGRKLKSKKISSQGIGLLLIGVVLLGTFSLGFYFFAADKIQVGEYTLKDTISRLLGDWGVTSLPATAKLTNYFTALQAWWDEVTKNITTSGILNVTPPPPPEVPVYIVITISVRVVQDTVKDGVVDQYPTYAWYQAGLWGWVYQSAYTWVYEYYRYCRASTAEGDILCTVTVTDTPPDGMQPVKGYDNLFTVGLPSTAGKGFMDWCPLDVNIQISEENNPTNDLLVLATRVGVPAGSSTFKYVFNTTSSVFGATTWVAKVMLHGYEHRYRYQQAVTNWYNPWGQYITTTITEPSSERYVTVDQGKIYETTLVIA